AEIAGRLGWGDPASVTHHKQIKELLHYRCFDVALTRNKGLVNMSTESLVNSELTKVNWKETHFRTLLKHTPYKGNDNAEYRSQLQVIMDVLQHFANDKKVTAKWITGIAIREAWYRELGLLMRDLL
ncbi:unnamed protein product, partial [marine sediment metagenome]